MYLVTYHWRSQGGKVMWALLGHIVKGEGNAAKQPRIRAFCIIYTWARANLTRAQARVCPGLATPLPFTKCPHDETAGDKVSPRRNRWRRSVPATKCQVTKCPRDKMAGDQVSPR